MPLAIASNDIAELPAAELHAGHEVYRIVSKDDLPPCGTVRPLLFPGEGEGGEGLLDQDTLVGFDIEWRSSGGPRDVASNRRSRVAPVSVVQMSSKHATVVVNLLALGESMGVEGGSAACGKGLDSVLPVFEDEAIIKVGLQCEEDLTRIKALAPPEFKPAHVVDCQVRMCSFARSHQPQELCMWWQ